MARIGSAHFRNTLFALSLLMGAAACGDSKADAKSPGTEQDPEMTRQNGGGGGDPSLPPLEEVEPAEEDVEVPPAP